MGRDSWHAKFSHFQGMQVLRDISTPDDGLYSVRDPMETRLTYVRWQMDNILSDPAIKVSILGKGALQGCFSLALTGPYHPKSASCMCTCLPGCTINYVHETVPEASL
jgi:hypothetical protein